MKISCCQEQMISSGFWYRNRGFAIKWPSNQHYLLMLGIVVGAYFNIYRPGILGGVTYLVLTVLSHSGVRTDWS